MPPLQDWSLCFPQSSGRPIIKSCWPSRPNSLGVPSSFVGSPSWEAWEGSVKVQNLHNSARASLVLLFSSLWISHPAGMGLDFIVIMPLLPSHCGFFLAFGHVVSFLVGSSVLLPVGCSTASCSFDALAGGDVHMSFYSAILNWLFSHVLISAYN